MLYLIPLAFVVSLSLLAPSQLLAISCLDAVKKSKISEAQTKKLRDKINRKLRALVKENQVAGVTYSVFDNQNPIVSSGVGTRKYDSNIRMHPENSSLRIASVSKLVTSMAALKLAASGHLNLNAKILELRDVPFVQFLLKNEPTERLQQWNRISVRDLMNHQAGISKDQPDTLNGFFNSEAIVGGSYPAMDGFLPSLLNIKFLFEPNQVMKYSNMGPNLLARIVEAKNPEKLAFDQYVKKSIFEPLGMKNSTYNIDTPAEANQFVSGYTGLATGRQPLPAVLKAGGYDGSIGVASSAVDLAKFGMEILRQVQNENPKLVTDQNLISQYYTPTSLLSDKMVWALGPSWVTLSGQANDQILWLGHMGTGPDMRSVLIVSPELGIGVSLLANAPDINRDQYVQVILDVLKEAGLLPKKDSNNQYVQTARSFMQNYKQKKVQPVIGVDVPKEFLEKFVGTYEADIVGQQKLTLSEEGQLVFYGQKLAAIDPSQNLFSFPVIQGPGGVLFNKEPVQFELDSLGNVISVTIAEGKILRRVE